jgi:hypothetical protein
MTFECEFSPEDWLAFGVYDREHSRLCRRQRFWLRFAFTPIAAVFIGDALLYRQRDPGLAVLFLIVAVVWFFVYPAVYDDSIRKKMRKVVEDPRNTKLFGKQTTTLTPEHVHQGSPGGESTITWDNVIEVAGTKDYVFLYTSTVHAIVIPRLSLKGVSFEDVRIKCDEYYRAAHIDRPQVPVVPEGGR